MYVLFFYFTDNNVQQTIHLPVSLIFPWMLTWFFYPLVLFLGCSVFRLHCPLGHISVSMYFSCYCIVFWVFPFTFLPYLLLKWDFLCSFFPLLPLYFCILLSITFVFIFSLSSCLNNIVCLSAHLLQLFISPYVCFWTKSKRVIVIPQQQELQYLTSSWPYKIAKPSLFKIQECRGSSCKRFISSKILICLQHVHTEWLT